MEAAKQNKKKTAIIAVVVVFVLAALLCVSRVAAKEVSAAVGRSRRYAGHADGQCGDGCG